MPTEMLDVVDDNDSVLQRLPREKVHAEYHIHRSVMFFVLDEEGRVFVNQRSARKTMYPNYWSVAFGGHVETGESYERAVQREIREEVGLSVPPTLVTTVKKRTADERENVHVYAVVADREPDLFAEEIEQGQFCTLAEMSVLLGRFDFLPETDTLVRILNEYTSRQHR